MRKGLQANVLANVRRRSELTTQGEGEESDDIDLVLRKAESGR
jgi:hypothetical protein